MIQRLTCVTASEKLVQLRHIAFDYRRSLGPATRRRIGAERVPVVGLGIATSRPQRGPQRSVEKRPVDEARCNNVAPKGPMTAETGEKAVKMAMRNSRG